MKNILIVTAMLLCSLSTEAQTYFRQKDLKAQPDGSFTTEVFVPSGERAVKISFRAGRETVFELRDGANPALRLDTRKAADKFTYTFDPAFHDVYNGTDRFYIHLSGPVKGFKVTAGAKGKAIDAKTTVRAGRHPLPGKVAMFGNSLMFGNGTFGMAASDSRHDYYHLITDYLKSRVPGFRSSRNYLSPFEANSDPARTDSLINSIFLSHLEGDEDMVTMNLGDNVNTPEKVAVFRESFPKMLSAVRAKCPKARVIVMGCWYGTPERYEIITSGCRDNGAEFLSFAGMPTPGTRSFIGAVQTMDQVAERTIPAVIAVEETDGVLKVRFRVGDKEYGAQFTCESHSLENGVLKYRSIYKVVTSGGVASHPSDAGFKLIADKFISEILQ